MKKIFKLSLLSFMTIGLLSGCSSDDDQKTRSRFRKIAENFYEATYTDYDYDFLLERRYSNMDYLAGGCSAIKNGNFLGRNFDFVYGDISNVLIRTPHTNERYATVGMVAGLFWLTTSKIEGTLTEEQSKIIPLNILDGINEKGVAIEINCVNAVDVGGRTKHTNPGKKKVSELAVVRYLLDHASSAENAIEILNEIDIVNDFEMDTMGLTSREFEVHFMITDKDKSYLVELDNTKPDGEKMVVLENQGISTNFYVHGTDFDKNTYLDHSMGVERYKKLSDLKPEMTSLAKTKETMESVRYTNSSLLEGEYDPKLGNGYTCYSDHPTFGENPIYYANIGEHIEEIEASMVEEHAETMKFINKETKENPNSFWCTCFTSCYDLINKTVDVAIYEDYTHYHHFGI